MKTHLFIRLCICCISLLSFSCSTEDDSDSSEVPNNNLITINIAEYPDSGDFIATLTSNLVGTLTYSITNATVDQAVILNGNELRVGDWLAFDFEANEELSVTVMISNGTETETKEYRIVITNVDDIWAFLNDSRTAYENATNGEWVMVSESEYNDLANYLAEITRSGATSDQLLSGSSVENYTGNRTIANDNDISLPQGSYLFAFKYYSWINNVNSSKVKLSEGDAGGDYFDIGATLPEHNDEFNHFVLKGSNEPTSAEAFIGMYASGSVGVKDDSSSRYKWRNGDVENLDNSTIGSVFLHQGLSTTLKQWD